MDGALHPSWTWHFLTSETISFPNIGPADHRSREKLAHMFDGTVCWEDLDWIRELWDGPILLKGVMRPEEAIRAADAGLDGVIVSNHGGRQLDHVPATIDVLPEIVGAAGDRLEVLIDSGFRRGSDIVAALALGARAVLLGRAHLYGLAAAGEPGVRHCIDLLADEVRTTMALCGASSVADLSAGLIRRPGDRSGTQDQGAEAITEQKAPEAAQVVRADQPSQARAALIGGQRQGQDILRGQCDGA